MAGRIKAEDITTVKERTSIEDVVRDHVTLRPAGVGSLKGLCPFHDEKTPSFTVRPAVGTYHCFGCGEGGDAIRFVMETEALDFHAAVEALAERYGMQVEREEDEHLRWAQDMRTKLISAQVTSDAVQTMTDKAEKMAARIQELFS